MTTIGLIGAGNIGGTLARLATGAGYDVVLSNSRGPQTLADLVGDLGPRARAATREEAAAAADLAVVTVPLKALGDLPAGPLAGKVVMDTINYYPERDGRVPALEDESTTTSELVQGQLPDSRVVKVFNNIFFRHLAELARPAGAPDRATLTMAGDDPDAKGQVVTFLDAIGYDAYDVGPLAEGWRTQRDTAAYAGMYIDGDDWDHPVAAGADRVRELLAAARRYRDM
ncbi:NAD(P)-binding domain-containing protein [Phycicoccus endophyticus]|uniref:NAD(P)-binding domain-containing protein n=1 Tax=Phycicoccus endophyticus TaxID=1690220 RepID=A0A7G9QZA4_9MICO|nr:NAD(P)-binding domain-containing protein [Phycicoccus endophyticus]NHI19032.1 NAD(P)-binding domain-containing protein [Phycicoccus endophyticus]QNN48679.1 NAD(P)-binding domain-containing protein [Phycicoccus endophyticus]GGL32321.1 NADP oxidoreductase [Phycicoccus endophyticus]